MPPSKSLNFYLKHFLILLKTNEILKMIKLSSHPIPFLHSLELSNLLKKLLISENMIDSKNKYRER